MEAISGHNKEILHREGLKPHLQNHKTIAVERLKKPSWKIQGTKKSIEPSDSLGRAANSEIRKRIHLKGRLSQTPISEL